MPPAERIRRLWHRPHVRAIACVVATFVVVAVIESALRPVYEAPDEISHLHYVQVLTDHFALPGSGIHERQQPPLYYLLAAPIALAGPDLPAVRALSLLCGALIICLCAGAAREVWPDRPRRWIGAALVAAVVPEVGYLAGSASNENLAWVMGAVLLLLALRIIRTPEPSPRLVVACGAGVGLATLTRLDDWPLATLLVGVMVWRWRSGLLSRWAAVAVAVAAACNAWWFARNLATFHSPLPPMQPLAAMGQHTLQSVGQVRAVLAQLVHGLAGTYGDGQVEVFDEIDGSAVLPALLCDAAVAGLIGGAVLIAVRRWRRWDRAARATAVVLGLAPCLQLVAVIANALAVDLQPQTRYLLDALPAFAIAVVAVGGAIAERLPRTATVAAATAVAATVLSLDVSGIATASSLPPFVRQAVPDRPTAVAAVAPGRSTPSPATGDLGTGSTDRA